MLAETVLLENYSIYFLYHCQQKYSSDYSPVTFCTHQLTSHSSPASVHNYFLKKISDLLFLCRTNIFNYSVFGHFTSQVLAFCDCHNRAHSVIAPQPPSSPKTLLFPTLASTRILAHPSNSAAPRGTAISTPRAHS